MAMTRRNPTRELMSAWDDFDRLFNQLMGSRRTEGDGSDVSNVSVWRPVVDITEHEKEYELTAELPGIQEEDIHLAFKDNVLTLSGEKKRTEQDEKANTLCRERRFGTFQRMIRFDSDVDGDNIQAEYTNGILTITMPKTKETMQKQIPVNFKK